jgi:hypothetical protein
LVVLLSIILWFYFYKNNKQIYKKQICFLRTKRPFIKPISRTKRPFIKPISRTKRPFIKVVFLAALRIASAYYRDFIYYIDKTNVHTLKKVEKICLKRTTKTENLKGKKSTKRTKSKIKKIEKPKGKEKRQI